MKVDLKNICNRFLINSKKSFTLVELSVVLAVVSILLAGAVKSYQVLMVRSFEKNNQAKMERIQASLRTFFALHGRLPRPANELTTKDANFGLEYGDANKAPYSRYFEADNSTDSTYPKLHILYGMVPTSVLGLPNDDAFDEYGGRIDYYVQESMTHDIGEGGESSNIWKKTGYQRVLYNAESDTFLCKNTDRCQNDKLLPGEAFYGVTYRNQNTNADSVSFMYNIQIVDNRNSTNRNDSTDDDTPIKATKHNTPYVIISHGKTGTCSFRENQRSTTALGDGETATSEQNSMTAVSTQNATTIMNSSNSVGKYNCYYYWHNSGDNQNPTTNYNGVANSTYKPISFRIGTKNSEFQDTVLYDTMETLFYRASLIDYYATSKTRKNVIDYFNYGGVLRFFSSTVQNYVSADWEDCTSRFKSSSEEASVRYICKKARTN